MKKLIPFAVLDKIQPLIEANQHLIEVVKSPQYSFCFKDADPESDFYYQVGHQADDKRHRVEYKPTSEALIKANTMDLTLEEVITHFTKWLDILDKYAKLHTIYDDPILKFYEDEFYQGLVMDEVDADTIPFDWNRQIYIDQYIEAVKEILKRVEEEEKRDGKKEEIQEIIKDCETLQSEITVLPKNKTVKKLASIWAKGRKYSITLIKELLTEFKKEGVKWLVKNTLEGGGGFFYNLKGLIEP